MVGRRPRWLPRAMGAATLSLIVAVFLAAPGAARVSDICVDAAHRASERTGVPFPVLLAITQTETGRGTGSSVQPWPWALNIAGAGAWPDNRADALAIASQAISQGETSVDIGCFQINYHWHGMRFASLDQVLDPDAGAAYAAQFLRQLHAETGDWSKAAGAYHSRTPIHAARYRQRFDRFHAAAMQNSRETGLRPSRQNAFPLLRAGAGQAVMGSLVPIAEGRNP